MSDFRNFALVVQTQPAASWREFVTQPSATRTKLPESQAKEVATKLAAQESEAGDTPFLSMMHRAWLTEFQSAEIGGVGVTIAFDDVEELLKTLQERASRIAGIRVFCRQASRRVQQLITAAAVRAACDECRRPRTDLGWLHDHTSTLRPSGVFIDPFARATTHVKVSANLSEDAVFARFMGSCYRVSLPQIDDADARRQTEELIAFTRSLGFA